MKTQTYSKTAIAIAAILASAVAYGHGDRTTVDHLAKTRVAEVVYDNPAYNRGIHSYPNLVAPVPFEKGDMFYVDKAHGQAIFSYPRNVEE